MTPVLLAADSITAPSLSYPGLLPVLIVIGAGLFIGSQRLPGLEPATEGAVAA